MFYVCYAMYFIFVSVLLFIVNVLFIVQKNIHIYSHISKVSAYVIWYKRYKCFFLYILGMMTAKFVKDFIVNID